MPQDPKKLTIHAYDSKRLDKKVDTFIVPVNPEQYAQSFKIKYDKNVAKGGQGVESKYRLSEPEELQLEFIFDGTDTIYGYHSSLAGQKVSDQIITFKGVVYNLNGETHQPRFLKLVWTNLTFDCVLTELQISYTLFDTNGDPLRAKLTCKFLSFKETERRVKEEGKNSPDLTHIRTVSQDQNLPLMVNALYGNTELYLEVARVNNLTNFRRLRPGQRLTFPPKKKASA